MKYKASTEQTRYSLS